MTRRLDKQVSYLADSLKEYTLWQSSFDDATMLPDRKELTPAERIVSNHAHILDTSGTVRLDWRLLRLTNTAVNSLMRVRGTSSLIASGDKDY